MLYRFSLSILVFGMLMGVAPTDAAPSEAEWQQLINGTSIGQIRANVPRGYLHINQPR